MSDRRRLVTVGLVGIVVATVLAMVLVQRVGTTYRDGLDVAAESASTAAGAVGPLRGIADDLIALADTMAQGLTDTRAVLDSAHTAVAGLGDAAGTELAETADGVADLAGRVAGVVETIERFIPGDRNSAAEDLRQIADNLAPTAESLRTLGVQLDLTATQLGEADGTVVDLQDRLAALTGHLDQLTPSADELSVTAARLTQRVDDAQGRVGFDLWLARITVVLIAGVLAIVLVLAGRPGAAPDDSPRT